MRIAVVGAGAVGGFLAARLAAGGHDVAVVARGPHLGAIREHGLTVEGRDGRSNVRVQASDRPADLGRQDVVVTTAKTPALPSLLAALEPLRGPTTPVVTAMNGVFWWYGHDFRPNGLDPDTRRLDPAGQLAALVPPDVALGMIIYSSNEVIAPGVVRNVSAKNRFLVGGPGAAGPERARGVAEALGGCGFAIEAASDIRLEMWTKLLRNLATAPAAVLTGAEAATIVGDPEVGAVARAVFLEAAAVAAAHGFAGLDGDVDDVVAPRPGPSQKPSMLQDLERGRPMEIDTMLAVVRDFARQAGVATPTLDVVVALASLRARTAGLYAPAATST